MMGLQRFTGNITKHLFRRAAYSSKVSASTAAAATAAKPSGTGTTPVNTGAEIDNNLKKTKNPLVAAAFESLKDDTSPSANSVSNNIDELIINAKTVNNLLSIMDTNGMISRTHALKIVSILAEWSSINRVKLAEFENDSRFLKICRVLGRTIPKNGVSTNIKNNSSTTNDVKRISGFRTDDLNTVLGVAGDDEAAKLIASITLPQMVKVMTTLALRKRRSTPLLRSLAFNISSSTDPLDLKQCADIFYAMATLNFQDSVLAAKICADIQTALPKNTDKSAVVGSILTSLGILKYRDLDILESLTLWTLKHSDICRPQDLSALFQTSAILNFKSAHYEDIQKKLVKIIVKADFSKAVDWLNHVWSLTLLNLVENSQLAEVLSDSFVKTLEADNRGLSPTNKMKLLNLNSCAQLMNIGYKGELLSNKSPIFELPLAHTKSKQVLLNAMLDALKSLLPSGNHVKSYVDSRMGFLIDAYCVFDGKLNSLPLNKEHTNAIKVALMVVDFHDICHGPHRSATGITNLSFDLLEKSGYKVIPVPFNEFNTSDKLLKRVQYLEAKFKAITSSRKEE